MQRKRSWLLPIVLVLVVLYALGRCRQPEPPVQKTYTDFLTALDGGMVADAAIVYQSVNGSVTITYTIAGDETKKFIATAHVSDLPEIKDHLRAAGLPYDPRPAAGPSLLSTIMGMLLPVVLIIGIYYFLFIRPMRKQMGANGGKGGPFGILNPRIRVSGGKETTGVKFSDVAGIEEAKEELMEIVDFLKNPRRFQRLGAQIPRGVLLIGPPGCGKTLLAKAVAGEAGVPFFSINGSEFIEVFVGVGASRVRTLFEEAKKQAPSIIFIDEIDAAGQTRAIGIGGTGEQNQTVAQLLAEMDGFEKNTNVIVFAATNRPQMLDPGLLRPGRFDRHILVDQADLEGRRAILEVHTRGKPLASDVDLQRIARDLPGVSGSYLATIVNEAALAAHRRIRAAEKKRAAGEEVLDDALIEKITMADFQNAIDRVMLGTERKSRKATAREREIVAYHEVGHALVAALTPYAEKPEKISILPRGMAGGYTRFSPSEERYKLKREYEAELVVALGGYAAEYIRLGGQVTPGSTNDRENASALARMMVKKWGMDEVLGLPVYGQGGNPFLPGVFGEELADYSEETKAKIEERVKFLLDDAAKKAIELLSQHRNVMDALVVHLKKTETMTREEFEQFLSEYGLQFTPSIDL